MPWRTMIGVGISTCKRLKKYASNSNKITLNKDWNNFDFLYFTMKTYNSNAAVNVVKYVINSIRETSPYTNDPIIPVLM